MDKDLEATLKKIPELVREREEDLDRRERELEKMRAKLEEENPNLGEENDVLSLNVGGTCVSILRRTLTQVEGSMLASKFSGRWDESIEKDSLGRFFIDQDMEIFGPLLNYLRALASQTEFSLPPTSPVFTDARLQKDFNRMVDYYGMTPGVFSIGMYTFTHPDKPTLVAAHPDFEFSSEEKETFWLVPRDGVHKRYIKSFEVTMGLHSIAQVGWGKFDLTSRRAALNPVSGGYEGAGYMSYSAAFDSTRGGIVVGQGYTSVPYVSVKNGTVIRCESKGECWAFDGETKISTVTKPVPDTVQIQQVAQTNAVPCLTVRGSFHITHIELDF